MLRINDPDDFRRTVSGLAMIAAPLSMAAGSVLSLFVPGSGYQAAVAEPRLHAAASLLFLAANWLFIPAMLGVAHLLRERAPVWGHIGGALMAFGAVCLSVVHTSSYLLYHWVQSGAGEELAVRFFETASRGPVGMLIGPAYYFGMGAGMFVLSIGLWMSRAVPRPAVVCLWAALLVLFGPLLWLSHEQSIRIVSVLLLLSWGWMGVHVLRMSNAEWADAGTRVRPTPLIPASAHEAAILTRTPAAR